MNFRGDAPIAGAIMKLLLTSAYDTHPGLDALRAAVARAPGSRHVACDSPEEADAILFVENVHFDDLRWSRLLHDPRLARHRRKSFIYNESDRPWDVLPGLYCSLTAALFSPDRHVPFVYLGMPNEHVDAVALRDDPRRWLFSFTGAMSHPCRRAILSLEHPDGRLVDTSGFDVWHAPPAEREARAREFADGLAASHFVLCPRGIGTASMRLFETMRAGRAPVIVADDWLPPPHVDWSFALRVPERRIDSIPVLLAAHADEAIERGRYARAAWDVAYGDEALFDTIGDSIGYLLEGGRGRRRHRLRSAATKWLVSGELATREAVRRMRRAS